MNFPTLDVKTRGQAWQDWFAYSIGGDNATYIEIGAYKPAHKNNTYILEVNKGWKGFSLELNKKWQKAWSECTERTNPIFWENAITFDYVEQLKKQGLPNRISYLSCDIEPPTNTLLALQRVIEQGVEFDCITFEHDNGNPGMQHIPDHDPLVREYLAGKGYKVAVSNVYCKQPDYQFETWFVKNDIDFPEITFDQWKERMGLISR